VRERAAALVRRRHLTPYLLLLPSRPSSATGPVRIFWRIMLPLVAPGLVATSVFAFIFAWNEFVFALTFLGTDTAK
jgi:ABC-type molybdate transport system permease subunit